jgi:hypothetical protein
MTIKFNLISVSLFAASLLSSVASASAEQWYFYIENGSDSKLVQVSVAEQGKNWSRLNIGNGIASGQTVKMIWNSSTDTQACKQWIKGRYADGSESTPSKIDFCQDLDDPIVF